MADRPTGPNAAGREDTVAIPRPQTPPTTGAGTNGTGATEGEKVLPPMPAGQGGLASNGSNGTTKPRPTRRPVKKATTSTAKTATPKPASPRPSSPPPGAVRAAAPATAPAPMSASTAAPTAPPLTSPSATTTAPVVPMPVPTPAAPQRPPKPSRDERRAAKEAAKPKPGRKARLRLTRVDPWSVMKTAFLLSIALGVVTVVCVLMVWSVLGAADVWSSINNSVREIVGGQDASNFDIEDYIGTRRVVGFTMIVAAVDVVLVTAICTLGAFLYNMSASLLGGIEVTLAEDN